MTTTKEFLNDPFWFIFDSMKLSDSEIELLCKISPKAKKLVEQNELYRKHYLELYRFKKCFDKFVSDCGLCEG